MVIKRIQGLINVYIMDEISGFGGVAREVVDGVRGRRGLMD